MRYSNAVYDSPARAKVPSYNGNYLGIVIQNNDPEKRGRVKVYVPHISPTIYQTVKKDNKNKYFKFPGDNITTDLAPDLVEELKRILPWCETVMPITSGNSGKYINYNKKASISDSNRVETSIPNDDSSSKYSLNADGTGEKYGKLYQVNAFQQTDGFSKTFDSNKGNVSTGNPNRVNPFTHLYKPKTYSNCTKGQFAIPDVGAHVWVFYRNGDPIYPVIFGIQFGQEDWSSVYQGEKNFPIDYPGDYNNVSKNDSQDYSPDTETYRSKMVLNQKGGVIEVVNTDNKEALRLTGYSGSYLEMNNDATTEFNSDNKQILTLADHFETINGYKNEYTQRDYDEIIRGDHFEKVGNFNKAAMQDWKNIAEEIGTIKQLFELKRTSIIPASYNNLFNFTSSLQERSGSFAPCPVCSAASRQPVWTREQTFYNYIPVNITAKPGPKRPQPGNWTTVYDYINDSSFRDPRASGYQGKNIGVDNYGFGSNYGQPKPNPGNFLGSGPCPVCGGSGISPSSQDGKWASSNKADLLKLKFESKINEITEIEKRLGLGGSKIIQISKHQFETVGLVMNDLPNIRVDKIGKITNWRMNIARQGVYSSMKQSSIYEYVNVEDLPGGTYNLNVCNRWNVLVGSGGIALKSYGPVDIAGSITNITGEQINLVSDGEINIKSKERCYIESDILVLRQSNRDQVLIDSNLGVNQNVVIGGSTHLEGEVTLHHITAPTEFQETEEVWIEGWVVPGVWSTASIQFFSASDHRRRHRRTTRCRIKYSQRPPVNAGKHSHQFRNVPLTLMATSDDVREIGKGNTDPTQKTAAFPPVNEKKLAKTARNGRQTTVG